LFTGYCLEGNGRRGDQGTQSGQGIRYVSRIYDPSPPRLTDKSVMVCSLSSQEQIASRSLNNVTTLEPTSLIISSLEKDNELTKLLYAKLYADIL